MPADAPRPTADPPPKTTLHCPTCGHQGRYDGDWRLRETASHTQYRCPECHTQIVSQPVVEREGVAAPSDLWRAWCDNLRAWQELWWQPLSAK